MITILFLDILYNRQTNKMLNNYSLMLHIVFNHLSYFIIIVIYINYIKLQYSYCSTFHFDL